jgi:hypothetical protein
MEAIFSFETSVRYIPEGGTLHNHRCENLKFYICKHLFLNSSMPYTFMEGALAEYFCAAASQRVPWVPEEFISGYQSRGLHLGPPGYEHGN